MFFLPLIVSRERAWLHVMDMPDDKSKHADHIMDRLKTTNYGRCVYQMENDQPDHYICNIQFEGNITAAFSMEAFTSYEGRRTRVMGSLGDIVGDMNSFVHTDFRTDKKTEWKQNSDGHGGGDWRLVADWIQAVDQQFVPLVYPAEQYPGQGPLLQGNFKPASARSPGQQWRRRHGVPQLRAQQRCTHCGCQRRGSGVLCGWVPAHVV